MPDYVLPDVRLRRAALVVLLGAVVLVVVAVGWFLPWVGSALQNAGSSEAVPIPAACYLFLAGVAVLAMLVTWYGLNGVRFGRRVLATGQYPAPGTRVIRRTRLVRGRLAVFTGSGQLAAGAALAVCGIALLAVAVRGIALIMAG